MEREYHSFFFFLLSPQDGMIGERMVIKPAPISIKKHYYRLGEEERRKEKQKSSTTTTTTTTQKPPSTQPTSSAAAAASHDEYDDFLLESINDEEHTGLHVIYEKDKNKGDGMFGSDYSKQYFIIIFFF
jgi:hypothetical protein